MLRRVAELILDDQLQLTVSFPSLESINLYPQAPSSCCLKPHDPHLVWSTPKELICMSQLVSCLLRNFLSTCLVLSRHWICFSVSLGQIGITHLLTSAGVPLWNSLSRRLQSLMRHMIEGVLVWSKYELNNELQRFARIQFWFIILKKYICKAVHGRY
jgi:hypothetical protein